MQSYSLSPPQPQVENRTSGRCCALTRSVRSDEVSFIDAGYTVADLPELEFQLARQAVEQCETAARTLAPRARTWDELAPMLDNAARESAQKARAYPEALRRDRLARAYARAAFRRSAVELAAQARRAIVGAFVVLSHAVRPRRARRPAASRAGPKAASSNGDGGSSGDDPPQRPVLTHGHGERRGALRAWSFHPGGRPGSWSKRLAWATP
jgi:hypothetical protein